MITLNCTVCKKAKSIQDYRVKSFRYCSRACKNIVFGKRMKGNGYGYKVGNMPWNKDKKGIHLSPASEFKPGLIPWNKNLKGIHLSPNSEFKKGYTALNRLPIGATTIRIDGNGTKRRFIKIADPSTWQHYAIYVWLQAERQVLPGQCLHHLNNDSLDDRLVNLAYVSRSEHPKLHNQYNTRNIKSL